MALINCSGKKPEVETVLWTNPSPTSSYAGNAVENLSDDITNYSKLKVGFRSHTSVDNVVYVTYNVDDIYHATTPTVPYYEFMGCSPSVTHVTSSSTINSARAFTFDTASTITFYHNLRLHNTTTAIYDDENIPIEIVGIN